MMGSGDGTNQVGGRWLDGHGPGEGRSVRPEKPDGVEPRGPRSPLLGGAAAVLLACLVAARPAGAAGVAAAPPPSAPPSIALVLPFVNGTGDARLDWIGVALQDAINIDLWYVGALHTWDLPNMVGQSKETPSALAVDEPAGAAKLAATLRADLVFAGRYRAAGDQITVTARLIRPGDG